MKKRIITGLVLAVILLPVVFLKELIVPFQLVVMIFGIIASIELLNMYDKEQKIALPIKILTVILTMLLYFSIVNSFALCSDSLIVQFLNLIHLNKIVTPLIVLFAIFIILMSCMVFVPDFGVKDIGKLYLSIIYIGVSVGAFTILRYYGIRFIVYLLLITIATDIFALVFGLTLGKHKMAPLISPKKTWEGAIGGTSVAVVIGFLFVYFYSGIGKALFNEPILFFDYVFGYNEFTTVGKVLFVIVLSLFLSVCSQIGDLVASKLKRHFGIKDYSNIFPGHGGVLDRFDSTFFASAIFLLFMIAESNLFPWA